MDTNAVPMTEQSDAPSPLEAMQQAVHRARAVFLRDLMKRIETCFEILEQCVDELDQSGLDVSSGAFKASRAASSTWQLLRELETECAELTEQSSSADSAAVAEMSGLGDFSMWRRSPPCGRRLLFGGCHEFDADERSRPGPSLPNGEPSYLLTLPGSGPAYDGNGRQTYQSGEDRDRRNRHGMVAWSASPAAEAPFVTGTFNPGEELPEPELRHRRR